MDPGPAPFGAGSEWIRAQPLLGRMPSKVKPKLIQNGRCLRTPAQSLRQLAGQGSWLGREAG